MNVDKLRRLATAHKMRGAQLRAMTDELRAARDDLKRETLSVWTSGRDDSAIYGTDPADLLKMPKDEVDRLSFDIAGARRVVSQRAAIAELQRQVDDLAAHQQTSGALIHRLERYALSQGVTV